MAAESIKAIAKRIQELKARAKKAGEGTNETSITKAEEFNLDCFNQAVKDQIVAEKEIKQLKAKIEAIREKARKEFRVGL